MTTIAPLPAPLLATPARIDRRLICTSCGHVWEYSGAPVRCPACAAEVRE